MTEPGSAAGTPIAATAEGARLHALHRYRILDTPDEEPFDRLAGLAKDLFGTPMAMVSLVDEDRQWFKARVGTEVRQTPRDWAFCDHAIRGAEGEVFVVRDATTDERFRDNPLVTGAPGIRFYAGAPLCTPDGFRLGTVCVVSDRPRPEGLTEIERRWLSDLAAMAVDELELRLAARRAEEAAEAEARLRRAQEAAGVVAFETVAAPRGGAGVRVALRRLLGLDPAAPLRLGDRRAEAHPEDRPRLEAEAARLAAQGGPIHQEFRTVASGDMGAPEWIEVTGEAEIHPGEDPAWTLRGVMRDVTERRRAEERQTLLAREVDHRAKNALAVVQSVLRLTPADDAKAFAAAVEGRVAALARALSLLAVSRWHGASLRSLVEGELRPFLPVDGGADAPRAVLEGPPLTIAAQAAQPISMVLHELATNAVKHGALSRAGGRIALRWAVEEGCLRLRWTEAGGPPVTAPPGRRGFGRRVLEGSVRDQLGGRIDFDWQEAGLACTIEIPAGRALAAGAGPG